MTNEDLKKLPQPLCSRLLYSIKEVCQIANIGRSGLYVDIKDGICEAVKLGGKTRIERKALIAYLNCKPFQVQVDDNFDPDALRAEQDRFSDIMNGFVDEHGNELVPAD